VCVCVCGCVCARACGLVQLQGLFEHKAKVPSLLNPATHTFKMASWADKASVGEGDMGTNVVWMYPQVRASEMAPAGRRMVGDTPYCPQAGACAKYSYVVSAARFWGAARRAAPPAERQRTCRQHTPKLT
jgi:hypothetical protein